MVRYSIKEGKFAIDRCVGLSAFSWRPCLCSSPLLCLPQSLISVKAVQNHFPTRRVFVAIAIPGTLCPLRSRRMETCTVSSATKVDWSVRSILAPRVISIGTTSKLTSERCTTLSSKLQRTRLSQMPTKPVRGVQVVRSTYLRLLIAY